ncbi:hypothetical protein E6B08_04790 [Pseudomonas putida]|uniref:Uncharacterized protein n=1 Tax=Pseudomonas putida TaxID=303 RepID=A0A4D6X7V1_PSEPU|nr:hypothetical protein [Pseudomonas putida]QCI10761.1 hypothetical protein E6B08_04790 [Pseudomonas putida]
MMPDDALRFTRRLAFFSIAVVLFGAALALYVLMSRTSSPIDIRGILALAVLWLTNLVSMLLNAVYWFIRRSPKEVLVTVGVQAVLVVLGGIPLVWPDTFF